MLQKTSMVTKKFTFIYLYLFICIAAVFTCYMEWTVLHYMSRLLIVPSLIYLIMINHKVFEHPLIPLLITATFFKFLGDIFFLVEVEVVLFRLFAICTFTVANVGYGLMYFFSFHKKQKIKDEQFYLPELILVLIISYTLYMLVPYFGMFQVPAVIYVVFSCFTLIAMARRRKYLSKKTYVPVLVGTIFFLTSDILHGLSVFFSNPLHDSLILVSFSLGHYFVIQGMSVQFKNEVRRERVMANSIAIRS